MSIKPKKKKNRSLSIFVTLLLFGGAGFLVYQSVLEILNTYQLTKELHAAESILEEIENENQYLIEQKTKLEDPEYVKSYARGTYMLSKEGEQIFYLPAND